MFELRRLRLQEKPVSECGQREELETMLQRRKVKPNPVPQTETEEASLTQQPNAIIVEIRGLVEQRPVSSILQSQTSRRNLEEAVQRSSERSRRLVARRAQGRPPVSNRRRSTIEQSSRRHSLPVGWGALDESDAQPGTNARDRQQWRTWDMNQIQRHTVAAEIGDLIQQQVVTSTLVSDFRGVLELHVQDRLQRSGGSGEDVQRFIQSLGQQRQTRSTSEGLNTLVTHDLSQEVQLMKADIEELKRMVRLSFELQLDVQRAIRQEVAAVINFGLSGRSADVQSMASRSASVASAGPCVICSEGVVDTLLYRCGHMCVCYSCAMELKSQRHNCPFCRAPIDDIVRAYQCQ